MENNQEQQPDGAIEVSYSRGRGKFGRSFAYVRPVEKCDNRSRRVGGVTSQELKGQIEKCIQKWFVPLRFFKIDGLLIGSSNEENALLEYWRICDRKDIKVRKEVQEIKP